MRQSLTCIAVGALALTLGATAGATAQTPLQKFKDFFRGPGVLHARIETTEVKRGSAGRTEINESWYELDGKRSKEARFRGGKLDQVDLKDGIYHWEFDAGYSDPEYNNLTNYRLESEGELGSASDLQILTYGLKRVRRSGSATVYRWILPVEGGEKAVARVRLATATGTPLSYQMHIGKRKRSVDIAKFSVFEKIEPGNRDELFSLPELARPIQQSMLDGFSQAQVAAKLGGISRYLKPFWLGQKADSLPLAVVDFDPPLGKAEYGLSEDGYVSWPAPVIELTYGTALDAELTVEEWPLNHWTGRYVWKTHYGRTKKLQIGGYLARAITLKGGKDKLLQVKREGTIIQIEGLPGRYSKSQLIALAEQALAPVFP